MNTQRNQKTGKWKQSSTIHYSLFTIHSAQRRGVTLLLVLGLMTMFALLVVTFMVVTTQARRAAESSAKALLDPKAAEAGEGVDARNPITHQAMTKLLVGDATLDSAIGPWSILENLFGHPGYLDPSTDDPVDGLSSAGYDPIPSNIQPIDKVWRFEPTDAQYDFSGATISLSSSLLRPLEFVGTVLTITEVPTDDLKGLLHRSTRILQISYGDGGAFSAFIDLQPIPGFNAGDLQGCHYIINGAPFSGTGPGFWPWKADSTDPQLLTGTDTAAVRYANSGFNDSAPTTSTTLPIAFRPNILAPQSNTDASQKYKEYLTYKQVLMNPDYTAPDHLNMFLSWVDTVIGTNPATGDPETQIRRVIPSFHRPGLVDDLVNNRLWTMPGTIFQSPLPPSLTSSPHWAHIRKTVLRPLPFDHPNFTGSNPAAARRDNWTFLIDGPWDVDSDGDGVADSVWIDAGLDTVESNGVRYKPLVAFHVRDMDGRLNINTHGNPVHLQSFAVNATTDPMQDIDGSLPVRGAGAGPAEVRLDIGLEDWGFDQQTLQNVLLGATVGSESIVGRYGQEANPVPGNPNNPADDAAAVVFSTDLSTDGNTVLGVSGVNAWAYNHSSGFGGLYPDLWGWAALSFDPLGNRVINVPNNYFSANPYYFDPYDIGGHDAPFLFDQMTAIFQAQGDSDFGFQQLRTRQLLGEPGTTFPLTSLYRHYLTPYSSDIPSPSRFIGVYKNTTAGASGVLPESIYRKIARITNNVVASRRTLERLPIEVRQGLRVNLNRPSLSPNWVNPTNDRSIHTQGLLERAKFAQEIFYLLLVLNYDEIFTDNYTEGTTLDSREKVITRLAQWSVNLVDFMDPDSVMTPFVFSIDPFNMSALQGPTAIDYDEPPSWLSTIYNNNSSSASVGPLPTDYRLIWGMEKPEVAITETLATHNRGTADATVPSPPGDPKENCDADTPCSVDKRRCSTNCLTGNHDQDFDQVVSPQGSLFVELYRCGDPQRTRLSPELAASGNIWQLDLAKRTGANTGSYIWRLAISAEAQTTQKRNDPAVPTNVPNVSTLDVMEDSEQHFFQPQQWPDGSGRPENEHILGPHPISVERFVWFGPNPPGSVPPNAEQRSYLASGTAGEKATLDPNQYLVIGPRQETFFASKPVDGTTVTDFGDPLGTPGTFIDLENLNVPSGAARPNWLVVRYPQGGGNRAGGLSVSEPLSDPAAYYSGPSDTPIDSGILMDHGTIPCYRSVFLQRLADPTRSHHSITNPYITVDWCPIDLHVFSSEVDEEGAHNHEEPGLATPAASQTLRFGSRQWGVNGNPSSPNAWNPKPNLWNRNWDRGTTDLDTAGLNDDTNSFIAAPDPVGFQQPGDATLGYLNAFSGAEPGTSDLYAGRYVGAPDPPFIHFTWNDSPLTNAFEVMQVPACTASTFGIVFHDRLSSTNPPDSLGTGHRFRNPYSDLGYLLGFEASAPGTLNLARFLEHVHVPSRFAGTIVGWTNDGKPIYSYREPGKINLNTVTETAWKALHGDRVGFPTYRDLQELRSFGYDPDDPDDVERFNRPFRSITGAALVPDADSLYESPLGATLLRSADNSGSGSKFFNSAATNMYTEYENVARLSGMTTNRSNVFAVWVTVGYFKVDKFDGPNRRTEAQDAFPNPANPSTSLLAHIGSDDMFDAVYPDGCILGKEKGLDDGTVKRHRAFYLIDRTKPVGFRRGETYLLEDGRYNHEAVIIDSKVLD